MFLLEKKCGRPWGRIIAMSKIKDLARSEGQFHGYSTARGFGATLGRRSTLDHSSRATAWA
jgi:hypothetical protein